MEESLTGFGPAGLGRAAAFIAAGGPVMWAIAALSVVTLALVLWKVWRLALVGAWSKGVARRAVYAARAGRLQLGRGGVAGRRLGSAGIGHGHCRLGPRSGQLLRPGGA